MIDKKQTENKKRDAPSPFILRQAFRNNAAPVGATPHPRVEEMAARDDSITYPFATPNGQEHLNLVRSGHLNTDNKNAPKTARQKQEDKQQEAGKRAAFRMVMNNALNTLSSFTDDMLNKLDTQCTKLQNNITHTQVALQQEEQNLQTAQIQDGQAAQSHAQAFDQTASVLEETQNQKLAFLQKLGYSPEQARQISNDPLELGKVRHRLNDEQRERWDSIQEKEQSALASEKPAFFEALEAEETLNTAQQSFTDTQTRYETLQNRLKLSRERRQEARDYKEYLHSDEVRQGLKDGTLTQEQVQTRMPEWMREEFNEAHPEHARNRAFAATPSAERGKRSWVAADQTDPTDPNRLSLSNPFEDAVHNTANPGQSATPQIPITPVQTPVFRSPGSGP